MRKNDRLEEMEEAYFSGGCFWCTEAIFQSLRGVVEVTSGYTGGQMDKPSYFDVSGGQTGHAEAIKIVYDPAVITYDDLLEIFFASHDPTTLNRQGADEGPQYRSAIFYQTKEEKQLAEKAKQKITGAVTEINPLQKFWPGEADHKNYYQAHSLAPYCQIVISPKLEKLQKQFPTKTKSNAQF